MVKYAMPPQAGEKLVSRPAVVITETDQIDTTRPLRLLGITSSAYQDRKHAIKLPWGQGAHTKLTKPSWVICDWIETVRPGWSCETVAKIGFIPGEALARIKRELVELEQAD